MKKIIYIVLMSCFLCIVLQGCEKSDAENYSIKSKTYSPEVIFSISDSELFNNNLCFTDRHRVIAYNISTGVETVVADSLECCELMATDGSLLWVYDKSQNILYSYDSNFSKQKSQLLNIDTTKHEIISMAVTKDYQVLLCENDPNEIIILNRKTEDIDFVLLENYECILQVDSYINNQVVLSCQDDLTNYIITYDLDNHKILKENRINYIPYYDTLKFNYEENCVYFASAGLQTFSVMKFSFDNDNVETVYRTGCLAEEINDISELTEEKYFNLYPCNICTNQNIVVWYDRNQCIYNIIDTKENAQTITLATTNIPLNLDAAMDLTIYSYEQKYGIRIKEKNFEDELHLKLALQSGSEEIDIYCAYDPAYISAGAYVDLNSFENLKTCKESCGLSGLMEKVASSNGSFFGVPIQFGINSSDSYYESDKHIKNSDEFKNLICSYNITSYLLQNVHLSEGLYLDSDYSILTDMLKWIDKQEFQTYNELPKLYAGDYKLFVGDYLFLNPNSVNQQNSVDFLVEILKFYAGQSELNYSALEDGTWSGYLYNDIPISKDLYNLYEVASDDVLQYPIEMYKQMIAGEISPEDAANMIGNKISTIVGE